MSHAEGSCSTSSGRYVLCGDEYHRDPALARLLRVQQNRGHRPPERRRGAEHTPPLEYQSMLDSFLVGLAAFYPTSWLKPQLIPWNPAAAENFYKNPLLAWLADNWKCIWVREGRRDLHALHRMIQVLPRGVMTLFPEGTRSRDGAVGPGRPGPGLLILATQPRVIPVAIDGMQRCSPSAATSHGSSSASPCPSARPWTIRTCSRCRVRGRRSGGDRPRDGSGSGPARRAPASAEARRGGRGRGTGRSPG